LSDRPTRTPDRVNGETPKPDLKPERDAPTVVLATECHTNEDRWPIGRQTPSHTRDNSDPDVTPYLRLVEDEDDFTPEEDDGALSLRSNSDKLSQKRAIIDTLTQVCSRNDILSPLVTLCLPLFDSLSSCHSTDTVSKHSRSLEPREGGYSDEQDADFTPRRDTRRDTRTRRAGTFCESPCKQGKGDGIMKTGGEDVLVTIGVGILCLMAGLVLGHELSSRISDDDRS
jgi:hypothetical protein